MMTTNQVVVVRLLLMAMVMGFAGCASTTGPIKYPPSWAPIETKQTSEGCPALEGTYSNRGTAVIPVELGEPAKLTEVFTRMGRGTGLMSPQATGHTWVVPGDAITTSFALTPETLVVTFVDESGEMTSLNFRRYHFKMSEKRFDDQFTCVSDSDEPRLRFLAEPESHSAVMAPLYAEGGGTLVMLLKAADGSLIVQWRGESLVVSGLLIGSHMKFKSVWWQYPLVKAD